MQRGHNWYSFWSHNPRSRLDSFLSNKIPHLCIPHTSHDAYPVLEPSFLCFYRKKRKVVWGKSCSAPVRNLSAYYGCSDIRKALGHLRKEKGIRNDLWANLCRVSILWLPSRYEQNTFFHAFFKWTYTIKQVSRCKARNPIEMNTQVSFHQAPKLSHSCIFLSSSTPHTIHQYNKRVSASSNDMSPTAHHANPSSFRWNLSSKMAINEWTLRVGLRSLRLASLLWTDGWLLLSHAKAPQRYWKEMKVHQKGFSFMESTL